MWFRILSFVKYYWRACTKYNVQSPFLHSFVNEVLDADKMYYPYLRLESARKELLKDQTIIEINDFGAGSLVNNANRKKIGDIATSALSDVNQCRILFQIINHYKCQNILELGTSLGMTSAYMAWAQLLGHVTTLEGDENIAALASKLHMDIGLSNINIVKGKFEDTLEGVLNKKPFDLVFMDGNHRYEPTMAYFTKIIPSMTKKGIIIVDDIYWSTEMAKAWAEIKKDSRIKLTVDLYDFGICFLNDDLTKQDISFITYKYKPWRVGLFGA